MESDVSPGQATAIWSRVAASIDLRILAGSAISLPEVVKAEGLEWLSADDQRND